MEKCQKKYPEGSLFVDKNGVLHSVDHYNRIQVWIGRVDGFTHYDKLESKTSYAVGFKKLNS
jgi:hypothetical protein